MGAPEQPNAVEQARAALAQAEAEAAAASGSPPPNPTQAPPDQQPTAETLRQLEQEKQQPGSSGSSTDDLLRQLIAQQEAQRREIAALREAAQAKVVPAASIAVPTEQEKLEARMMEIQNASFYCPACGNTSQYPRQCEGKPGVPGHPTEEMVSVDELLSGDPANHTAAQAVAA